MEQFNKNLKAQSEMVGFVLIVIIVAVILLIVFSLSKNQVNQDEIESYKVQSFLQSSLEYTTNCSSSSSFLPLRRVIFQCAERNLCENGIDPCREMEETWKNLIENSWIISSGSQIKGYNLNITQKGEPLFEFKNGNITNQNKMSVQNFDSGIIIFFRTYV